MRLGTPSSCEGWLEKCTSVSGNDKQPALEGWLFCFVRCSIRVELARVTEFPILSQRDLPFCTLMKSTKISMSDEGGEAFNQQHGSGEQGWSLFGPGGQRKYLTPDERLRFIKAAKQRETDVQAFCWLLADTGCRITEALHLTTDRVDTSAGLVIFESLKKRRPGIYRAVPVREELLTLVNAVSENSNGRIWHWHRMTAYRRVREVMTTAGIHGPHANARGLRHSFAIAALEAGVPLNLVQRWLGHASMATTAIYADAVGIEERKIANRLWTNSDV